MKHEVLIYNKTRKRAPKKFIEAVIFQALNIIKLKRPVELAVLIIGEGEIKNLNKAWRGRNNAPDELSFGLDSHISEKFARSGNGVLNLGEIVLNVKKISNKKHLSVILAHGLLHLLGHSHSKISDAKKMEFRERKILLKLGADR